MDRDFHSHGSLMLQRDFAPGGPALGLEATLATPETASPLGLTSNADNDQSRLVIPGRDSSVSSHMGTQQETQDPQNQGDTEHLLALEPFSVPPEKRAKTPRQMAVSLMEHQKVCLTWLMQQEDDPLKKGGILAGTTDRISASLTLSTNAAMLIIFSNRYHGSRENYTGSSLDRFPPFEISCPKDHADRGTPCPAPPVGEGNCFEN